MKKQNAEETLDTLDGHEEEAAGSGSQAEEHGAEGTEHEDPDTVDIDQFLREDRGHRAKGGDSHPGKAEGKGGDEGEEGDEAESKDEGEGHPDKGKAGADAAAAGAGSEQDDDPVVEVVAYRGTERQVRKSQQRALLSKGVHLETVLEQLSPLRRVYEDPEVFALLQKAQKAPGGLKAVAKALRTVVDAPPPEEELPEVEGYSPEDVKASLTLLKKLGVPVPGARGSRDAEGAGAVEDAHDPVVVRRDAHVAAARVLAGSPEEYRATVVFMKDTLRELRDEVAAGKIPSEQYDAFVRDLNDPNQPENFLAFFRESHESRRGRKPAADAGGAGSGQGGTAGAGAAAGGVKKIIVRSRAAEAHGNQDRLPSGGGGGSPRTVKDPFDLSEDDLEKFLREA